MLGDSFEAKIHLHLTYLDTPPLKTVRNSDVGEKLLTLFHFKNVDQLSTTIALALSRLEAALPRILAWCLHLAARCCKDSCNFCCGFEDGVVLRGPTTEIYFWKKLLNAILHF